MVRELGYGAVTKGEHFGPRRVEDTEWIAWCGDNNDVALTKDDMIRRRTAETSALLTAGLTVFCPTNGNLTEDEQVRRFRRHWPAIIKECHTAGPKMVGVYADRIERFHLG